MYSSLVILVLLALSVTGQQCDQFVRTYDGSCNNLVNKQWGAVGFFKQMEGYRNVTGLDLPNERTLSNKLLAYPDGPLDKDYTAEQRRYGLLPDPENRNSFFVMFAQFVAHDVAQNPLFFNFADFLSNYKVQIDPEDNPNDPLYQPDLNGKTGILTMPSSGVINNGVFYSRNNASNWVDLSPVYGSSEVVANKLRAFQGGRLMTDDTGLGLPFASINNVPSECGAFRDGVSAAGDLRADENGQLTAIHTMFVRIHNIYADRIAAANPTWSDEQIFQEARKNLIAVYQNIVYHEFLPLVLGPRYNRFRPYRGYDNTIDPTVTNSFATAAFRVLHDMVPLPILILRENCSHIVPPTTVGAPQQEGSNCIPLFFREIGMEAVVRGALDQFAQAQDGKIANGLRSVFLRGTTPGGNLDVETSNIFRGRDHGLLDFNSIRAFWGKRSLYEEARCNPGSEEDPIECFLHITKNETLAADLKRWYKKVDRIDAYVGMLAESKVGGLEVQPTAAAIIMDQFDRLRHGDRFYFENTANGLFSKREVHNIKRVLMSDLIELAFPSINVNRDAFLVHNECHWE